MPKPIPGTRTHAHARTGAGLLLALLLLIWAPGPAQAWPTDWPQRHRVRSDRVENVLEAARQALGTPYRTGGASPGSGFDCSGLTMWAWRRGGVKLPHSSSAQYGQLRHVKRSQLQPGDLLFFYSPIHHVTIYVGHGRMIEAAHSGTRVRRIPVYWQYYTGAGRPK